MSKITITINNKQIIAEEGKTVFEAAKDADIKIPSLCYHSELSPYGACRLCVVQIEGIRGYPTSCTTPAREGMVVKTDSLEIKKLRKNVLKLMLSGHTSPCLVCLHRVDCEKYRPNSIKTGKAISCTFCSNRDNCELRELSAEFEIKDLEVPIIYNKLPVERDDPFMDRDYNLCILCGRCVRICEKLHGSQAISFVNRGRKARIGTAFNRSYVKSDCVFCGACIDVCPTGVLKDRYTKWNGKPDKIEISKCTLCPVGCSMNIMLKNNKVIGTQAISSKHKDLLCATGRFVYPQIFEHPKRLLKNKIRAEDRQRNADYSETVKFVSEKLKAYSGNDFALIADAAAPVEELNMLRKFTKEVMKSDNFGIAFSLNNKLQIKPKSLENQIKNGSIKALVTTGNYLNTDALDKLECFITSDCIQTELEKKADAVFASAILAETAGSYKTISGDIITTDIITKAPGGVFPNWKIFSDISGEMGGAEYKSIEDIIKEMNGNSEYNIDLSSFTNPVGSIDALPIMFRGHNLAELATSLKQLVNDDQLDKKTEPIPLDQENNGFKIIEKKEIVPNTHMIVVHAPNVARNTLPGQFVIAMAKETSERIPYTISDFNVEEGTVTFNALEAGRSSREMAMLNKGDYIKHFAGPLGSPIKVESYGTVVLGGGCYGVGAMLPLARALKQAGNKVICIEEASSHYLLYWQNKLEQAADEFLIATKDGSVGTKGGVQEVIAKLVERGEKIDQAFIIGCTFMMMLVSEKTKELGIPTQTALNPIMLDGTGMCGACRVTVSDKTKFTCVDGPFFDGHKINWKELLQRQSAYSKEEIQALPQDNKHKHTCMSI